MESTRNIRKRKDQKGYRNGREEHRRRDEKERRGGYT